MRTTTVLSCLAIAAATLGATGCATTTVEPGHRGLYFAPNDGGLKREPLQPGKYALGWCFLYCTPNRVDDFDVTYSTKSEDIVTKSSEGLDLTMKLSVIYRPVVSELYALDTEIGPNYYDEVVGPEFRSACRGVFARHSYTELQKKNESIENEVEAEVRRRTAGKHVEISSITLETVNYAPEIADKIRQKIAAEQEASRQQAAIVNEHEKTMQLMNAENEQHERKAAIDKAQKEAEIEGQAAVNKLTVEKASEQQRLEMTKEIENSKFVAQQQLATMDMEKKAAKAQLEVGKLKAEANAQSKIIEARADAEAARSMALAHAAERRAETAGVTPMEVMVHAYDALAHLGGTGTTIVLGDWAHVPHFLFPKVPSLNSAFTLPYMPFAPAIPAPTAAVAPAGGNVLSNTAKGEGVADPYGQ